VSGASVPVRLAGLTKQFGSVTAVAPLDLEIAAGEFVVLVGPSGCGKTTILRMIAGLEEPTAGSVAIGDRDVTDVEPADRDIAMVFQNYALYPHMTVAANLAFGLKMRRMPTEEIHRRVERATRVLGLETLLDRRPGQLSGGQRQRVALGRAIVRDPRVFLFDEPLSNLDARLRAEMRQELKDLHRRLGATMIFVTHDQVEAMTLGDRIAVLEGGVLQQYDTPLEVYRRPANLFVAKFVGTPEINTADGTTERPGSGTAERRNGGSDGGGRFRCTTFAISVGQGVFEGPVTLAVRPEDLAFVGREAPECDVLVEIDRLEPLGNELLVHVKAEPHLHWAVRARNDWRGRVGEHVGLHLDASRIHLFDAATGARLE
jgi:ABC-type sugar transport system ATPase subunit